MTTLERAERPAASISPILFAVTTFASAGLVFLVQPMVAKLVLPLLGGSSSVWNTSIAFFQAALLVGYGYAHFLQKIRSVRIQALVHVAALLAAALALPLRVTGALGEPSSDYPSLWLLGVLAVSIGAPFAILSATAPLVQAWHARTIHAETGAEPYVLYAASNLGSLLALLAYPAVVEPLATLHGQTAGWSTGYVAFVVLMATLALFVSRARAATIETPASAAGPAPSWRDRAIWIGLAAIPSSLMLGVTTHITTDVASAPFLWVIPLALYLLTFIIAFSDRPIVSPKLTLMLQAAAVVACAALMPFKSANFMLQLTVHLAAFFLTALMCHQALVARRPDPAHLTEFYLWMSFGGVVGGAFNAFLAPVIFTNVWEYPLVLVLACLARPGLQPVEPWRWATFALGGIAAAAAPVIALKFGMVDHFKVIVGALLVLASVSAFVIRRQMIVFFGLVVLLSISAELVGDRVDVRQSWRSFFGVLRQSEMPVPAMGGAVKMLSHGTTLHGAQAQDPRYMCRPLVYYAPETPIGQVFSHETKRPTPLRVGAVGLGTGAVAAYSRKGDHLTFFEIDPLVIRLSTDPKYFSYTTTCAKGAIDYVVGDARLTLAKQPAGTFDVLLIDAFSSDAVPAHLLTVEAMKGYLAKLKPDGVLIVHLSNRNLELRAPAMAVAEAAGGFALIQRHSPAKGSPPLWESAEDAMIVSRSLAALAPYEADGRWAQTDPTAARPWTDDYMNLAGAMYAQLKVNWPWLP
ncbi:fused MFS/spermidine synthase [Phenylobacterium sp. NIBR 498073]|uniref:spermidine synthase n=1 Tax=Phenylobacterium sp. NIBR 498073 TaxID=3015177 RepID=UPI0022B5A3AF|nr:fused MFS/spermidine synthase [Phenylobacterium sp. NIBR 498073]WGU38553.1 fused MFS/spermidine synthase [Phenylobacterium sp. NIBR 498073]